MMMNDLSLRFMIPLWPLTVAFDSGRHIYDAISIGAILETKEIDKKYTL